MTRGRVRAPPPSLSTAVASAGGLPGHEELEYVLDRVLELEGRQIGRASCRERV